MASSETPTPRPRGLPPAVLLALLWGILIGLIGGAFAATHLTWAFQAERAGWIPAYECSDLAVRITAPGDGTTVSYSSIGPNTSLTQKVVVELTRPLAPDEDIGIAARYDGAGGLRVSFPFEDHDLSRDGMSADTDFLDLWSSHPEQIEFWAFVTREYGQIDDHYAGPQQLADLGSVIAISEPVSVSAPPVAPQPEESAQP